MKKVLIISHSFYHHRSAGAVRHRGLDKYLPTFKWDPVILTASELPNKKDDNHVFSTYNHSNSFNNTNEQNNFNRLKTFNNNIIIGKLIDFIFSIYQEIFLYPDAQKDWYDDAVNLGSQIIEKEQIDAIISSSYPVTSHLIAQKLKEKYSIPWVADFRDLWTQNQYYNYSSIRKHFESKLEYKTLKDADALVTVSDPLSNQLKNFHKTKTYTILNGYDPDQKNPGYPLSNTFTINYTGILYSGKRNPEIFLKALQELIKEKKMKRGEIQVNFYGPIEKELKKAIIEYNLQDIVFQKGSVSRKTSIEIQRKSHVLLLITDTHPREKGVVTAKLFDYLAAERPIFFIGTENSVIDEILKKTNAGTHLFTVKKAKKEILRTYHEFKSNKKVSFNGITDEMNSYTHIEMAKNFATVLNLIGEPL